MSTAGLTAVDTLIDAVNRHDVGAIVAQFTADVRSDTPAHPARSFVGSDQVGRNWTQILGSIRDLEAHLLATATTPRTPDGRETVWAEIAFDGHRPDGGLWRMRGVTVNEIVDGRIAALRFYLEPVEDAGPDADGAARAVTTGVAANAAGASR